MTAGVAEHTGEHSSRRMGTWPMLRPVFALTLGLTLIVIYGPLLADAARRWATDGVSQYGFFILPLSLGLAWARRDQVRACVPAPTVRGVWLLGGGLLLEATAFLLRLRWFPLLSLVPVLAGAVLALHGPSLWRVLRFPLLFLAFLAPVPPAVTQPAAVAIQRASTSGTTAALNLLGVPAVQNGFEIDTPTVSVEVAQECSGFKKLTTLLAFAVFYGSVYGLPWPRRLLLLLAVPPVALAVNILRIGGLVLIGAAGGLRALHAAHDGAEICVVVVSFLLLTGLGRALGCRQIQIGPGPEPPKRAVSKRLLTPDPVSKYAGRPVLPMLCLTLLLLAAVADHALPRLDTRVLTPAPIAAFPRTLGGWTCVEEHPADTPVLPTAHLLERTWQDPQGQTLQSLLLTARDYADFHDPTVCLPLQGFALSPPRVVRLAGTSQDVFLVTAVRPGEQTQILYWWQNQPTLRGDGGRDQWGKLLALRDRLTGTHDSSLFVRLLCPSGPGSAARLTRTAAAWEPTLAALCRPARH